MLNPLPPRVWKENTGSDLTWLGLEPSTARVGRDQHVAGSNTAMKRHEIGVIENEPETKRYEIGVDRNEAEVKQFEIRGAE